jgi:hypothetical protein
MTFNLGNVVKYCWRLGLKSDDAIAELGKAEWYIGLEIERIRAMKKRRTKLQHAPAVARQ